MQEIWICDSCGLAIDSIYDGWVEWLRDVNNDKRTGMRIVHHRRGCMYNEQDQYQKNKMMQDHHLEEFATQDGLLRLLELISDGQFINNDEVIEVIKRLFVRDYEFARNYFDEAAQEGYIEHGGKPGSYRVSDIKRTMQMMKDKGCVIAKCK